MAENNVITSPKVAPEKKRPLYEKPRIQLMSERDILSTFQITQAMATWWGSC